MKELGCSKTDPDTRALLQEGFLGKWNPGRLTEGARRVIQSEELKQRCYRCSCGQESLDATMLQDVETVSLRLPVPQLRTVLQGSLWGRGSKCLQHQRNLWDQSWKGGPPGSRGEPELRAGWRGDKAATQGRLLCKWEQTLFPLFDFLKVATMTFPCFINYGQLKLNSHMCIIGHVYHHYVSFITL